MIAVGGLGQMVLRGIGLVDTAEQARKALLTLNYTCLPYLLRPDARLAVLVLRRDHVAAPHFRTPTLLPILAIGSCLVLLSQQDAGTWLRAGLLMALGALLYGFGRWHKNRRASAR